MIFVGGENLMDMIQTGHQNDNGLFEAVPGGSPYNLAMAVGRQGVSVGYLTPISQDSNGDQLAKKLVDSNVTLCGSRSAAPTSLAMVSIDDGVPSYAFYREGTAERQVDLDELSRNLTEHASIFHIGSLGLTGGEDALVWEAFVKRAKEQGVKVSLDPNVRASLINNPSDYRARIARMMAMADILKLSDEDLEWLYEGMGQEQALETMLSHTKAEVVVLTKGGEGSSIWHDGSWHDMPSHPLEQLVDTVGAGDTFMASMLVWLSQNEQLETLGSISLSQKKEMQTYAGQAAALNCQRQGCNPPWSRELIS